MGFPAALKYLSDRGVTQEDINALDIRIVPAQALKSAAYNSVTYDERIAVVYPHFDFQGKHVAWWSARLVDTGPRPMTGFQALVPSKRAKMFCPPNEPVRAYLPPICDWQFKDGERVYIHESTLKAINGAKLGGKHIGLNGVEGWSSKKHNIALIAELKDMPWKAKKLIPVIVFDSNWDDNDQVALAISRLGAKLYEFTGQWAIHLPLPKSPTGDNWGFDDFCVTVGAEAAREFLAGEGKPVETSELEMMKLKLNTEVCIVTSLSRVVEQASGIIMTRASFTDVNYADYVVLTEEGKQINVPKAWLADKRRLEVETMDYLPGQPRIVGGSYNLWKSMGLEPAVGDVQRWLDLMEHNVQDAELRQWMLCWMAWPLQNPGQKLNTFMHVYGPPGTGKQAVLRPLMRIYGQDNAVVLGREHLSSSFNSVFANKQFINVDEMHNGSGDIAMTINNKMKKLVTDDVMVVNMKGVPEYSVRNCANIVTTSNYPDSIRLDDDDRRCCVIRFGNRGTQKGREFWEAYYAWVDGVGAAAVYDYLLTLDLGTFDPKGWAPMTEDKVEVTRATRNVLEQWVGTMYEDPDQVLPPILRGRCLMSGEEMAQYAFSDDPTGVTPGKKNQLGIKLHGAGFSKVELKVEGKKVRFWVVRKKEQEWTTDDARKHLKAMGYPGIGR